jgi:segregation and condensation protein A
MYEFKTEQFSGPIEKLLEMIEAKKMEITDLNLAEVTADFLDYLEKAKNGKQESAMDSRVLSEFIVIASRLILIKSKALLPSLELSGEDEQEIEKLKDRLKFYKEFRPALALIKKKWAEGKFSVSRPLFANRPAIFYPAENITFEELKKSLEKIFESLKEFEDKSQPMENSIIRLEEKIEEILEKLASSEFDFEGMAKERGKTEVIVMFLAVLHLLARRLIKVEQNGRFSGIMLKKHHG